jgi:DNA repair exonuclease SbcCD ATPase subunit
MELSKSQTWVLARLDVLQRGQNSFDEQRRFMEEVGDARHRACGKVETVKALQEGLKSSSDSLLQRMAALDNIESRAAKLQDDVEEQEFGRERVGSVWPIEVPSLLEKEEAGLSEAWTEYRDALAREQVLATTAMANDGPWVALEPSVLSEWAAATTARVLARNCFDASVQDTQRKHEEFARKLGTVAMELRENIGHNLHERRRALEKEQASVTSALERAQTLYERLIDIHDALGRQDSVCEAYEDVCDQQESIQDEIDSLGKAIQKAQRRMKAAEAEIQKLADAKERMKAFRRSPRFRRAVVQLRQLMKHLPELGMRFGELNPFNGTAAQLLQPRELDDFKYEELQQGGGGRHRLLKARLRPQEQHDVEEAQEVLLFCS